MAFVVMVVCATCQADAACTAEQAEVQAPKDLGLCRSLEAVVRKPGALPLRRYEEKLGAYLGNFCYRAADAHWRPDKHIRATGPFIVTAQNGGVQGHDFGTHAPVIVWYSPDMLAWLKANRAEDRPGAQAEAPIPDGAMMVKEMYPAPALACAEADAAKLMPSGAAIMVRDNETTRDGWFWGWFGWKGWAPDWPAPASSPYPNMGFGQYCVNCHASAQANQTFSSLRNIKGEPGEPLVYLSQAMTESVAEASLHEAIAQPPPAKTSLVAFDSGASFLKDLGLGAIAVPVLVRIAAMPPATYDNVWLRPKGHPLNDFVTSDQCLGCHDAGSTGLQFDMTNRDVDGRLVNLSSYGTWRSSPMGMAGRDPIFFAQLASETERFHPKSAALVEDTCLGCHGVLGQRAFKTASKQSSGVCQSMTRATLDVTPFPDGSDPVAALAAYAGLARDGVSCVACHRAVFGAEATKVHGDPQNACLDERRALLTPGLTGFAASFTGSFDMGPPDVLNGPFQHPREMPMRHALGIKPVYNAAIGSSELCGACHTVHLPILEDGRVIGHTYEQTTYAEWAFSAYRTGTSPDGALPLGAGAQAQSCQDCHMPSQDGGHPIASKIASIQEYSNFPQTENVMGPAEIDMPVREHYARHTLVGLNLVFVKMAQLFPTLLGISSKDPMLVDKEVDPLVTTERAMRDQARRTATVTVSDPVVRGDRLDATVTVTNRTGHKFPSGVGFRRAFVEFIVRDARGSVLWSSGQTNRAGVILDGAGKPLDGELWWRPDCSARLHPDALHYQPHHEIISRADQVQIYEDLAAMPAGGPEALCKKAEAARGPLTTSFLSRCFKVKDNRLLPSGYLDLDARSRIAAALGADKDLAEEAGATAVGDDPDYRQGGGDTLRYSVPLADIRGTPASVEAALYYQSTPPYYLQDRACTAKSKDTERLTFLAANLDTDESAASVWKLDVAASGRIAVH